ncbi:unnamed protein product [Rotaria magnacalcarata]|uniref:Chitin-binding type-4 domain-containing protein n=1 Tax=Rotaria magnacalcarata TaxID=392030 RepID=A0A816Y9Y1_9BILA|nr:unnamed protein product [Rotaria magnacalcarata]CAF3819001.1 unnamed protein product [Rotaria magnacalcarata]
MRKETLSCFILIISLPHIYGHGRMEDPPARNAAWRFGFNVPTNYDDVGLNCGGLSIQKANGGKCGVCGDSYSGSRDHEMGGKYSTNVIVRHYVVGSLIDVKILLTANHVGFMELRLCPSYDPTVEVTQECLDKNLLYIDGFGTQYPVNEGIDSIFLRAHLPPDLSCSHCVLQWRYHAGNSWGTDFISGKSCLGCGHQEEFYNCADISIASNDNNDYDNDNNHHIILALPETTTIPQPFFLYPYNDPVVFPSNYERFPMFDYPTTTTPPPPPSPTTTPVTIDLIYPLSPSNEFLQQMNKSNKIRRCYPTNEILKPIIGIENWCLHLCAVHCPPTLCACVEI